VQHPSVVRSPVRRGFGFPIVPSFLGKTIPIVVATKENSLGCMRSCLVINRHIHTLMIHLCMFVRACVCVFPCEQDLPLKFFVSKWTVNIDDRRSAR